ncbi:MAG: VOC family protein [Myxococcota bacterium]|nr:VOC family protein [Myxococcota bacterium]
MSEDTPEKSAPITPYLYYEDVEGALDWLSRAFGFREREAETMRDPEGKVVHASMALGDAVILLGFPGKGYQCPKRLGQVTQNLYVYVPDVERHLEHARQAGAEIFSEAEDTFYGDRRYGVADLEGHHWYFAEKIRAMAPEDWQPTQEDLKGHR